MVPILFLHNPKAGGTSVAAALRQKFDPGDVSPYFDNSPAERRPEDWSSYSRYRFVAGHFGYEVKQYFPHHVLVTNFRHPVRRIVSMYNYWRSYPLELLPEAIRQADNGPTLAHQMSLSEFVRSRNPYLSLYLDNFHVRQLTGSGWIGRRRFGDMLLAKLRIRKMPWFYVCERPDLSVTWLRSVFPEMRDTPIPHENVTTSETETALTSSDIRVIEERNKADLALYGFALKQLERRALTSSACLIRRQEP
ncbi:Sulfotransferase family [Pseudomonas sp. GM78]|uniref:sulfotransferase family 2 domain-containing protein n=1 Tax=Pseudomonas sp. GM78 TaxID=1144337 RepID=UPI000270A267|nr:sulfotransferase family 2 domain-containing protein [Pseudomonas sp. GM78]EJN24563.1 Sulfotransferase family [Pseudomonas sp. GM78]